MLRQQKEGKTMMSEDMKAQKAAERANRVEAAIAGLDNSPRVTALRGADEWLAQQDAEVVEMVMGDGQQFPADSEDVLSLPHNVQFDDAVDYE